MKKLLLLGVAEVAFLTPELVQCTEFYRKLGLGYSPNPDPKKIHFADVGEQLFGFAHEDRGFFTGYAEEFEKANLHVAFEVPYNQLDDCAALLVSNGVKPSPRVENSEGWHGAKKSASIYFKDPAGNIMELWARWQSSKGK